MLLVFMVPRMVMVMMFVMLLVFMVPRMVMVMILMVVVSIVALISLMPLLLFLLFQVFLHLYHRLDPAPHLANRLRLRQTHPLPVGNVVLSALCFRMFSCRTPHLELPLVSHFLQGLHPSSCQERQLDVHRRPDGGAQICRAKCEPSKSLI